MKKYIIVFLAIIGGAVLNYLAFTYISPDTAGVIGGISGGITAFGYIVNERSE